MKHRKQLMGLARKQLDRHFSAWRKQDVFTLPSGSWVRMIREALGMTSTQLARRLGVSQPRVPRLEQAEKDGSLTLASLRRAAEALDCTLVYALLPNKPLEDMVRERATMLADAELARVHHTMRLEDQALGERDFSEARTRLISAYLEDHPRRLWEEP